MLATREKVLLPTESSFKSISRADDKFESLWHYHPEFEITLILNGQGRRIIGDEMSNYQGPALFFIPPDIPHTCISENESGLQKALVVQFDQDCLGHDFFSGIDFKELSLLLKEAWSFPRETALAAKLIMEDLHQATGLKRVIYLFKLLELLNGSERQAIANAYRQVAVNEKVQEQMNLILNQLLEKDALSVPELALEMGMSESTFRRFFKKNTGRSLIEFHNEMRINSACLLLQNHTDLTISQLALEVGFKNLSHFNRQFLRWKKCPPREYRQRYE